MLAARSPWACASERVIGGRFYLGTLSIMGMIPQDRYAKLTSLGLEVEGYERDGGQKRVGRGPTLQREARQLGARDCVTLGPAETSVSRDQCPQYLSAERRRAVCGGGE